MPVLARLFVVNGALGFLISALFTAILLWLNVQGLYDMMRALPGGLWGVALIWVLNGMLFGVVQIAYVVMTLPEE